MHEADAARGNEAARLKFGLIGCGDIGAVRLTALAQAGAKVVAVSDIDAKRGTSLANRHEAVYDRDWHTLLARPDIDAVIVSTPPSLHQEMCVGALSAGKHVLCEKPLARSPQECQTILDAALHSHRLLAVGFNYRFYPSFVLAREVLAAGRIGDLSHIRAYAGYSATGHNQDWVRDANVVGGGALHDNGIHLIDLVRSFLGEVEEVSGWASSRVWGYGEAEDNGFLLLRSPENRIATVHASWTEWDRYQFRIELVGTLGKITATCFPMRTEVVWSDRVGGRARKRIHSFLGTKVGEHTRSYRWVVARSFVREFEAFAQAVAGRPSSIATGVDGRRAIEIAQAARHLPGPHASTADNAGMPAGRVTARARG